MPPESTAQRLELPRAEILKLAAVDSNFYCHEFFPKTFRQDSPEYHRDFWRGFENPHFDFFGAEIYRGGGKTTLTRAGISKRLAYAISRNILAVAISEAMAVHTVRWIKRQIETNSYWTSTYMLHKGSKWTDDWIEVYNEPFDCIINVIAKGMTSGLRGLNPDDWRPDFIFCDDISNEETVGTPEQREKNYDLFFGALVPSLAPKSEAPMRKLVLAQTGLHKEDIIYRAHKDPSWHTVKYPKLVQMPNGELKSAWEMRYPTQEAVEERETYIRRNQYHVWLREFGCRIISRETAPLDPAWLKYWKGLPEGLVFYTGLDPATDSQNKNVHRTAGATIGVLQRTGDTFLVEYFSQKGKNPDEMWVWFVAQQMRYHPRKNGVEAIAFQKFLVWYFKQQMDKERRYVTIDEVKDRRPKPTRILQALSGLASNGKFWVSENQTEFVSGYTDWDGISDWDLGDATAQAITLANPWMAQSSIDGDEAGEQDESEFPALELEDVTFIRRPRGRDEERY